MQSFLLDAMEATAFKINNIDFPYVNPTMPKELEKELKFYLDLDKVLSMIGLDFDKPLKDADEKRIETVSGLGMREKGA